jgi:exosortase
VKISRRAATQVILYTILALLLLGFFRSRLLWMGSLWWSDGLYSLSALVPFISLAIVYSKRNQLRALSIRPSALGLAVVLVTAAVTLAADSFNILHSLTPLLLVAMLAGLILALWGTVVLRALLFPLGFLLLLVPVPPALLKRIDLPLQVLCARAVEAVSRAVGMATQRAGSMLLFPGSDSINVAPACNGVRSSLTMLMLSILYVYFSRGRWYSRLAVVAAAVPFAYLANLVRLLGLVSGAHLLGQRFMNHEQAFDQVFGLLVFSGCVAMLLLWARWVKCASFMETF